MDSVTLQKGTSSTECAGIGFSCPSHPRAQANTGEERSVHRERPHPHSGIVPSLPYSIAYTSAGNIPTEKRNARVVPGQRKQREQEIDTLRQSITCNCLFAVVTVAKCHNIYNSVESSEVCPNLA